MKIPEISGKSNDVFNVGWRLCKPYPTYEKPIILKEWLLSSFLLPLASFF